MKRVLGVILCVASVMCSADAFCQETKVQAAPTDTAAWALARYATNLTYGDLPPDVVAITKRHILDSLGTAFGAYTSEPITVLRNVIVSEGGKPESTIIGSGQKTNCVSATMVNGAMIRYLDFNDTYWSTKGFMHPSNSVAEALAVAERQHASGKDLIVATVLAYEVQSRLADTFRWPHLEQHSAAGFTAPIVAGKLLGLSAEQMANAIGIGASHNFALQGDYGIGYTSNMKSLGYAAGSASGVTAALLAQKGFTGPVTIIETYDQNFEGNASLDSLTQPRQSFAITQAEFKPYEAFHVSHSAIMGVIQLTRQNKIDPDQIERVFIRGLPFRQDSEPRQNLLIPSTKEDADHNLPFLLAMGIIDGAMGPDQYSKQQWKEPRVQTLMKKMWFQGDAEMTKDFPQHWKCLIEITTKDKKVYRLQVDLPKGQPGNPMTDEEIEAKFTNMATKLMPAAQAQEIIDTVLKLDEVGDVSTLTKLLVVPRP